MLQQQNNLQQWQTVHILMYGVHVYVYGAHVSTFNLGGGGRVPRGDGVIGWGVGYYWLLGIWEKI